MTLENPIHFGNRLWILIRPMPTRNDKLTLGSGNMAAPVRHDAICALGGGFVAVPSFASVGDDRVEGDILRDGNLINRGNETVIGIEGINAAG